MTPSHPYRLLRPSAGEAMRGIRCLIAGPETVPNQSRELQIEEQIEQFQQYAVSQGISLQRQVMALEPCAEGEKVVGVCLWIPSPGKTASLFAPNAVEYPHATQPACVCITEALADAQKEGVVLTQAMLDPADTLGQGMFEQAGLQNLATLLYMERKPPALAPGVQMPVGLHMETYSPGVHQAFAQAIMGSYEDTLDCPTLSGTRHIDDVIAGHRAVGVFDPLLWWVIFEGTMPLGCLLLAEIPARRALEIVYLGLTRAGRGRGIGRALMQRTLATSLQRQVDLLSVAVDQANIPALRLYRRFGYATVAQRLAMIKKLG